MKKSRVRFCLFACLGLFVLGGFGFAAEAQAQVPPIADAGFDRKVAVGEVVVLDATRSETSGPTLPGDWMLTYAWSLSSVPAGSAAVLDDSTAVKPSFTADVAGDYVAQLIVSNAHGTSTADTVTVSTVNVAPVADAGRDRLAAVTDTVVLDGSGSTDFDGDALTYSWTLVSVPEGSSTTLNDPNIFDPSFLVDLPGSYEAELVVSDGVFISPPSRVVVDTEGLAPQARAVSNVLLSDPSFDATSVNGSDSFDADGSILEHHWWVNHAPATSIIQMAPPRITPFALNASDAIQPVMTIFGANTVVLQLQVLESTQSGESFDYVLLTAGNLPPTAVAGPAQTFNLGNDVILDGTESTDLNGDRLTYRWSLLSKPVGSVATIPAPDGPRPSFTPDLSGSYIAQLVVHDGLEVSRPSTVIISTENIAPVADAGPDQSLTTGVPAQLDGSNSSDADGDPINYKWSLTTKPATSTASLSDPNIANPTFTPDVGAFYIAQLIADDGLSESEPDTTFFSSAQPVADAGPDATVSPGTLIQLDGSASGDLNANPLTYAWSLLHRPAGSTAQISDPTLVDPTFTADVAGIYIAQLVVESTSVYQSLPDTVVITVGGSNQPPVADAGPDRAAFVGDTVAFDGNASSDPDGDPLTFAWSFVSTPAGSSASLSGASTATPSFVVDEKGTYVAQLIVNDGTQNSTPDQVSVTVSNRTPVADAGQNQIANVGATVQLDGGASSDPDGDSLTFAWSFLSTPAGSTAAFSDAAASAPTFVPDLSGDYQVQLIVNDGQVDSLPSTMTVMANPAVPSNSPPVLDPIGNQTVALGSTLSLSLAASDADGDPLSFIATPLPLPAGAQINAASGAFSFAPNASQVGDVPLTFSVSDGIATDSESVVITVTGPAPGGVTALAGRLLDTNDFALGVETPIVGATVSVLNGGVTATSDANGDFTLSGIPSGIQVFDIDAATAAAAPDGSAYASFREAIELIADVTNVVSRPFFLPRIEGASLTTVDPTGLTLVENTRLGISLQIPAGSAKDANGLPFTGQVSISEVPLAIAPASLPEELEPGLLITIQPVGVVFDPPALIDFPDIDGLNLGSRTSLWSLDPDTGSFDVVGIGEVVLDGGTGSQLITTIAGGIRRADWHMFMSPRFPAESPEDENSENQDPDNCEDCNTGSITQVDSGSLQLAHELAGYRSQNELRSLRFVYNSTSADPQPLVPTNATVTSLSAVPDSISTRLRFAGVNQSAEVFTSTAGFDENVDETVRQVVQLDAQALPTGLYPYRLFATSNFSQSSVSRATDGQFLVNNEIQSPFGAGWTLDGLHRVHAQGSTVILTSGSGSVKHFQPVGNLDFGPATPFGSDISTIARDVADVDGDGFPDIILYQEFSGKLFMFLGNGAGGIRGVRELQAGVASNGVPGAADFVAVQVGDFDGDRIADLVVGKLDELVFYRGLGDGFFSSATSLSSTGAFWLDVTDMNGDSLADLVVGGTSVRIYHGLSGVGPGIIQTLTHPGDVSGIVGRDLNDDGLTDIVTASSNDQINVYLNQGTGAFALSSSAAGTVGNAAVNQRRIDVGDVTGDGFQDIIVGNGADQTVSLFAGDGTGAFPTRTPIQAGHIVISTDAVDVNGDGLADIVANGADTQLSVSATSVMLSDGVGSVGAPSRVTTLPDFGLSFPADLTGDGLADFLMVNPGPNIDATFVIVLSLIQNNQAYRSPAGDFSTLTKNANGTFARRLKDGTRLEFDAAGLQTALIDRNNNTTSYAYDGSGLLTSITDPKGLVTTLAYAGSKLTTVTDPAGRITGFTHDAAGNLTEIADPDGSTRVFSYDARHRLTAQMSKRGFTTTYEYNFAGRNTAANRPDGSRREVAASALAGLVDTSGGVGSQGNPASPARPSDRVATFTDGHGSVTTFRTGRLGGATEIVDPLGRTITTSRDENNQPVQIVRPNGRVDEFTYDSRGNLITRREAIGTALERTSSFQYEPVFNRITSATDWNGNTTLFEYDAQGNLTKQTDALGGERLFTYDSRGQTVTKTDENGNTDTLSYDQNGNLAQITNAALEVTRHERDSAGNLVQLIEAVGLPGERQTTFTFDVMNRPTGETDPSGATSFSSYDASGNLIETEDQTGLIGNQTFDELDRIIRSDDLKTGTTDLEYDGNGNLVSLTDQTGARTEYLYDEVDQLVAMIDPLSQRTDIDYDVNGNILSLTNPRGAITTFEYDLLDRTTKTTNPLNQEKVLAYDLQDNLLTVTDAKGQTTTNSYDALNREILVVTPDNTTSVIFDLVGNITSIVDDDSTITKTYDSLNRQITEVSSGISSPLVTLTYQYDELGNRIRLDDSEGGIYQYSYDSVDRLVNLVTPVNQIISFTYDAVGRPLGVNYPNGVVGQSTYDPVGRLASFSFTRGLAEIFAADYQYDTRGMINSIDEDSRLRNFTHDPAARLVSAGTAQAAETYSYDSAGNRLSSHLSVSHTHNLADRLAADDTFDYVYDANGNLASKTVRSTGATTVYSYDATDQLVRIDRDDGVVITYAYDGLERRISKTVDGVATRYVYDGQNILLEFDSTNTLQARYTHGDLIDQPLAMERNGLQNYYHADHRNSIRKVTNEAGFVVNSYDYDAFGNFENRIEAVSNPFAFTGREIDTESNLYYYRARYYDPVAGRYFQEDPLQFAAGDTNLYRYVFNNPVNFVDPSGQILPQLLIGCGIGAAAGVVGGFAGEAATSAAAAVADEITDAIRDQFDPDFTQGGPCDEDVDTPTVDDFLDSALSNAISGCIGGAIGAALLPASIGAKISGGFIGGFASGTTSALRSILSF